MKKIKVAQVLAGAAHGGAENFFVRLTCGLHQKAGIDQKAFIRKHADRLETLRDSGVSAEGFRFGSRLHMVDRWHYLRALRRYRPDIVMTWMNRSSRVTPSASYRLVSRLGHYYNLKYYRHADYWVGISQGICDHLVRGGMPSDRVFHLPNFADETEVAPVNRSHFSTPADRPLLLAAGRLHVNKAFDTLLKALTKVPDAVLWLAGTGPEEAALKKLCGELDLTGRVRFLGWRNDVTALMATADLFVCPSRNEGLGSIVLESWAHRCPIVATDSQGPGELIDHEQTGLLTPIDDDCRLAEAINGILADTKGREQLVENACRHYYKNYSKEVVLALYQNLYKELASKPRP